MRPIRTAVVAGCAALLLGTGTAAAAAPAAAIQSGQSGLSRADQATLLRYAADTWRSMVAMVNPATGLPADNMNDDLTAASRSRYTSPTNIGAYLWSTVAARDVGLIGPAEAHARLASTLRALSRLDRHPASGMFYNWYDPADGAKLRVWPVDGSAVHPFLSSVDNGWLAAALMVVRTADPSLRRPAEALLDPMDFGFYYNPDAKGPGLPGLIRGGFWDEVPPDCSVVGNYRGRGPDVWYTCNHYDITNTEPRIASYIGIARGQIPAEHYFATWRTFPNTCDWNWQKQQAVGENRSYLGVPVFEGAYQYAGQRFVPTWGGDMFEALMPALFVPEEQWGPRSWGRNHPAYVQGQIAFGLQEAGYGYWGFSPASNPQGGYAAYGAPPLGMASPVDGYPSDLEKTQWDKGFGDCRPAQPEPTWGDGVITPHASFLALPYAPRAAIDNLAKLRRNFDVYGRGGFADSVAVRSGTVAHRYLALDQGMIMGALGNVLGNSDVRRDFAQGEVQRRIRPLLGIEEFNATPQR
ncbi:MAG TPA: glucoamylase family protein [Mycobacteriales bacterium]|nr:glucoamylase family protein [Mycobacteriales bacterium]